MTHEYPKVAVIGCGYWGKNLVRNFSELGALGAVVDGRPEVANAMAQQFAVPAMSYEQVLGDTSIAGVVIAAPAELHASLALQAFEAQKHVYVEKPIALSLDEGNRMQSASIAAQKVLMIGHLLRYHPAFEALLNLVSSGGLGDVRYAYSNRLSLGKFRTEENVLWSFAPHDVSMLLALISETPNNVTISSGAYVIPYGRGNSRSVAAGEVVAMIGRLVAKGVPEVVLSGVDMTSWGSDLPGKPVLGELVARILKLVPDLKRLRLSSVDAVEIDDTLFRLFAEEERLMPHLHLSLQHGSDLILKRMKRRHLRADAITLVARLRAARPNMAFGADIIAGFPTETEAHFADSVSLVDEVGLAFLHVFPYSPRPMTPAANMPQLDKALIKQRAALLRAKGDAALAKFQDAQIGTTQRVLIERDGKGRLDTFAEIMVAGGQAGATVMALVTGREGGHLVGVLA